MDILNFISWIKGKRVVTTVDPTKTLLPVGIKTNTRDDDYLTCVITVEDFINTLPIPVGGGSIWTNNFTPVGCIDEDVTLPTPGNFTYPTPLAMCVGKTLTIPVGTTLTIV